MPIRFRCPKCDRMLGIARRKAGTQIECPQCGKLVTVPVQQEDKTELADLDDLLNAGTGAAANGSVKTKEKEPPRPVPKPVAAERAARPLPPPVSHKPPPKPTNPNDRPLFEKGDVDAMLGIAKAGADKLDLDDDGDVRVKPVNGMDALSLASDATKLVLSPGKATLLAVCVVVLLGVAFAAGYWIASK